MSEGHAMDLTVCRLSAGKATEAIAFGTSARPDGLTLTVDSISLLRNGRRWLTTMGEFHFSRYPRGEWRDELLKMRAGGIDVVSTYVFWIHHEEIYGQWDWSDRRDLRTFVSLCGELDFPIVLRVGPWAHGEVRNGGLPDWLLERTPHLRSDDPVYLDEVRRFYGQIVQQVEGFWWRQGGPIIGVQIDNEYWGPAEHLLTLKEIARQAGMDAPLYTRTAWPELTTPMPYGEFLPLYGGYAEGFWDRTIESMPGQYWREFVFRPPGDNATIATDIFGTQGRNGQNGEAAYPYLTCELGGGMMSSYHRRIRISPQDVTAMALVRVGSGSNLPGYYMYHGGTNPDSASGVWLSEAQATRYTNHNDLPVKTYDFQAPLGEFGQVRESYHGLRMLHLFLHDFGEHLAEMPAVFPGDTPTEKQCIDTLRWSVRSDGQAGFIFVNNYQRGQVIPAKTGVQFELGLVEDGRHVMPEQPVTVPTEATFVWPFNLPLGPGATLGYATAQPVCRVSDGRDVTYIFAETAGITPEFALALDGAALTDSGAAQHYRSVVLRNVRPGLSAVAELRLGDGRTCRLVLLDRATALRCWKGRFGGIDRVILSDANPLFDGESLRLYGDATAACGTLWMLPAPAGVQVNGTRVVGRVDGVFGRFDYQWPDLSRGRSVRTELVRSPGTLREIRTGAAKVAEAPDDAAFDAAAVWRIVLPMPLQRNRRPVLRIHYIGDVARLYANNRLLDDNFYNGQPFDFGVWRLPVDEDITELTLKVLPLQNSPLIAIPPGASRTGVAELQSVEWIESCELVVSAEA